MRVVYLDAFSGIAGDMTVGAFLDAGLDLADLEHELKGVDVGGYRLRRETRERSGIHATKFVVDIDGGDHEGGHADHHDEAMSRGHHHPHRRFREIRALLEGSKLSPRVGELALRIFGRLAEAEGKVHGVSPDDVAFHEVGAIDAIVDVVGAAWAFASVAPEEVYVSPLPLGQGRVRAAHGPLPVPGPATMELLRGFPVKVGDGEMEMVTPTGAAIVAALAKPAPMPPEMAVQRIGYGAGDKEFRDRPNLLRVLVGTLSGAVSSDALVLLETNLDDMNPEIYDWVMERLFAAGARDVFLVPTQMKKNRPGTLLSVLCDPGKRNELAAILFAETTTLGVRVSPVTRLRVEREQREVETRYGRIRVKVGHDPDGTLNFAPEYDDCKRVAGEKGVPLKTVYQEALRAVLTGQ